MINIGFPDVLLFSLTKEGLFSNAVEFDLKFSQ